MGRFDRPACMMDPHSDQSLEIHRMKLRLLATTLAALTLVAGTASAQDTSSEKGKLSYALGYDLVRNLVERGDSLSSEEPTSEHTSLIRIPNTCLLFKQKTNPIT